MQVTDTVARVFTDVENESKASICDAIDSGHFVRCCHHFRQFGAVFAGNFGGVSDMRAGNDQNVGGSDGVEIAKGHRSLRLDDHRCGDVT